MNATRIKKAGKAVAGSALLVGATLTGAAGLAAASSHNSGSSGDMSGDMSLADYPTPFVGEDGTVNTAIVVGEQAATIDVVGAINIAGSLGNQAFTEEAATVDVEGSSTGGGFTATNGVSLDTRNDPLFFGDNLNEVRDTLTDDQLDRLETTTFTEGDADTEIENFLRINPARQVQFGQPEDRDNEDPVLFVDNPEDVGESTNLFQLQADFDEDIDFTDPDVESEEIELFGQSFTIGTDSSAGDELVLLGSQDVISLDNSQEASETTTTIGGEEVTIELVSVTGSGTDKEANLRVNGQLTSEGEDQDFTVNGVDVRVDELAVLSPDQGTGVVDLAIGDQEIAIPEDGGDVEDGDDEDIDGLAGEVVGAVDAAGGVNLYVGAEDDDREYVLGGETYEHPNLPGFNFHFGGLSPDVAPEDGESPVEPVEVEGSDAETLQVGMGIGNDETTSIEFLHADENDVENDALDAAAVDLADSDDDAIVVNEGGLVSEDEYVTSDAGDFPHVFEVTNIDRDATGDEIESGDEATIDLEDEVDGQSVEVDLDAAADDGAFPGPSGDDDDPEDAYYAGTEVIDGQTYRFALEGAADTSGSGNFGNGDSDLEFHMAYGDGTEPSTGTTAGAIDSAVDLGPTIGLYPAVDTGQRASVAFTEPVTFDQPFGGNLAVAAGESLKLELPSTESTDARTVTVEYDDSASPSEVTVAGTTVTASDAGGSDVGRTAEVTVGEVPYEIDFSIDDSTDDSSFDSDLRIDEVSVDEDDVSTNEAGDATGALVLEPEDDADDENVYYVNNGIDTDDDEVTVAEPQYLRSSGNGPTEFSSGSNPIAVELESDDDVSAGYDVYGSYTEYDDDDGQHSFELYIPAGQAVAGAAFTDEDGDLTATGGGSGTATTQTPTGFPEGALLDTEVTSSQRQNTNHILVGGPAVNTLVADLAEANKTMAGANYSEGDSMIQLVEDSFAEGANSLIVSGFSGEDTRQAANRLANADENPLPGQDQVMVGTGQ